MNEETCERCGEVLDGCDRDFCEECLAHIERVWEPVFPE